MAPARDNVLQVRPATVAAVIARAQREGAIDAVGIRRTQVLAELLRLVAERIGQDAERIEQYPTQACSRNRAILELGAARAVVEEALAVLDEHLQDWKHDRDIPIGSELYE